MFRGIGPGGRRCVDARPPRRTVRRRTRSTATNVVNELVAVLRSVVADLHAINARFAIVGGLAVSARAEPRLTRDVDVAISVSDDGEAERLVTSMSQLGYRVAFAVEQDVTGRLSTVRLVGASSSSITDLLFASCGIETEIAAAADDIEVFTGVVLPVATVGHLVAMKLLARDDRQRPADADDLRSLREVATTADWNVAREAVGLIEDRGYNRGRDLRASLETLIEIGAY